MLAFALAGAGGAAGAEESARASLAAELATSDPVTGRTIRVEAGQPFRLSAMLTDVTTGRAPRGVALAGGFAPSSPAIPIAGTPPAPFA